MKSPLSTIANFRKQFQKFAIKSFSVTDYKKLAKTFNDEMKKNSQQFQKFIGERPFDFLTSKAIPKLIIDTLTKNYEISDTKYIEKEWNGYVDLWADSLIGLTWTLWVKGNFSIDNFFQSIKTELVEHFENDVHKQKWSEEHKVKKTKLKLTNKKLDSKNTKILKSTKLFSKTNGSFEDSIISAGFHAKKQKTEMFVYSGNSMGVPVWRVSNNKSDFLNPVASTGNTMYSVDENLNVYKYEIQRSK